MTIDAGRLEEILKDCLLTDEEASALGHDPTLTAEHYMEMREDERPFIPVLGVIHNYVFNPSAVKLHTPEIKAMLDELPDDFKVSGGGGMSFLNACMTRNGDQWGEHRNVEQLLVLGIATGLGNWALPKEMWFVLPGGTPYFIYDDQPVEVTS